MLDAQSELARREYVIPASQQRVWDILASAIIQCMPVEQMQVVNDTTILGVLRLNLGAIEVPLRLKVKVADISPIESLATRVTVEKGPIQSSLKVTFALTAAGEKSTKVVCVASEEERSFWMMLLKRQQRSFAGQMFEAVQQELERSC